MIKSKRELEGYLVIDHTASPGVIGMPRVFESATITCSHCQAIVVLNPNRSRPRNYCAKCDHYICDNPVCIKECHPFKAIIEELSIR